MSRKYRLASFVVSALCVLFMTVNLQAAVVESKPPVRVSLKDIPHLEKRDGMTKLIVDGHPFICIAGELSNTASSDRETTKATIAHLAQANFNTILTVVSWDLVEPEEGKFDFSMIDYQIEAARANNVRLVLLWMASWKIGLSHFPPLWVKANQSRFPRVVNGQGKTLELLSTLSDNNRIADATAFAAVMRHIREVDKTHTVIAFQVENEVGTMGTTRDFGPAANTAFAGPVPKELTDYLLKNKDHLLPELKQIWDAAGDKTSGTWEQVFGKNVQRPANDPPVPNSPNRTKRAANAELFNHTDEIFMAWNYSHYIGYVAAQGKKEYPLPMYVNTWLVQPAGAGPHPLVLLIHGGPFAQFGERFSIKVQALAAAGYAVLFSNPTGSTGYGEDFANALHDRFPGPDHEDLMRVVDAVAARPEIDAANLFITGTSGGGVLTCWAVTHTHRFRAAVAIKPVTDWQSWVLTADMGSTGGLVWMGHDKPWENVAKYRERSPLAYAQFARTPTLMVAGEADSRTPPAEAIQMYAALKLAGVETALLRMPGVSHGTGVMRPSYFAAEISATIGWFERFRQR